MRSRAICHANDREQQAQLVAGNPRRRGFSTETPLENADQNSSIEEDHREEQGTSLRTAKATLSTQRSKKHVQRQ